MRQEYRTNTEYAGRRVEADGRWLTNDGSRPRARGVTLLEIMVVVAILAILLGIVVYISGNMSDSAKIDQTKQMMETLVTAIVEYRDLAGNYPPPPSHPWAYHTNPIAINFDPGKPYGPKPPAPYAYYTATTFDDLKQPADGISMFQIGYQRNQQNSDIYLVESIEGLVCMLRTEPATKAILGKVAEEAFQTKMADGGAHAQTIRHRSQPPVLNTSHVIIDPWGNNLRYTRHKNENNNVPYFMSAGPDEKWNTDDDICSFDR
jgi:prepilin-type N-terminal cleavage/methylation domain-containing protein